MTTLDRSQTPGQLKLPVAFTTTTLGSGPCRLPVAWQPADPQWSLPSRTASSAVQPLPVTVNYHLNKNCNYGCRHCYAVFNDAPIRTGSMLPREEMFRVVAAVAAAPAPRPGVRRKLTFAGGEPTLVPWLPELIAFAKQCGLATMLVTNGSRLSPEYLDRLAGHLDWLTWSLDALDEETNRRIGRADTRGQTLHSATVLHLAELARHQGMRLKVNTVVNHHNHGVDFSEFLLRLQPERWKILQVMPVAGQNDTHFAASRCDDAEFVQFVDRHRHLEQHGIRLVPESVEAIRGSYAMIDPHGRFFDSADGGHRYSAPILEIGLAAAFAQVSFDPVKFIRRGGAYDFGTPPSADVRADAAPILPV